MRLLLSRCLPWLALITLGAAGCQQRDFPNYPANYREYAYISNGGSNTVTVLDVVNMRQDRVIAVGSGPIRSGGEPPAERSVRGEFRQ